MNERRSIGGVRGTSGAVQRPGGSRRALVLGAAVVVLVAGGGAALWAARGAPEPAPSLHDRYAKYMTSYPFGGRNVVWWSDRLNELAKGTGPNDPALFELTLARTKAAGLDAQKVDGVWVVNPSETLSKAVLARLGVE